MLSHWALTPDGTIVLLLKYQQVLVYVIYPPLVPLSKTLEYEYSSDTWLPFC